MKKLSILTAVMLAALSCFAFSACGGGGTVMPSVTPSQEITGSLTYEIEGEGCIVVDYVGNEPQITLPETYMGLPITAIYCGAFQNNTTLESITLPETVTLIDEDAFRDCTALKTINGTAACEEIGANAFRGCVSLQTIDLSSVKNLGTSAFECCTSLKKFFTNYPPKQPDSSPPRGDGYSSCVPPRGPSKDPITPLVLGVGTRAFYGCVSLQEVFLPREGITFFGAGAFQGCSSLQKIYLPETLTDIYQGAFQGCSALECVFNASDKYFGEEYFGNATISKGGWFYDYDNYGKPTLKNN